MFCSRDYQLTSRSISNVLVQTRVLSVWRIFKGMYVLLAGCDHYILKNWKCHSNPWSWHRKEAHSLHMGTGTETIHVVRHVHAYIKSCWGLLQYSSVCHPRAPFGNPLLHLLLGVTGHQEVLSKLLVECQVCEVLFVDLHWEMELHLLRYQYHQKNYMLAVCIPVGGKTVQYCMV